MGKEKIELQVFNDRKITVLLNHDKEFPSVDLYLETNEEFLLIASLEDSQGSGIRLMNYMDLTSDEPIIEELKGW